MVCVISHRAQPPPRLTKRATQSRNQPSLLSRAAPSTQPHADQKFFRRTPASRSGVSSHPAVEITLANPHRSRTTNTQHARNRGAPNDHASRAGDRSRKRSHKKRDSSHENVVSVIKFSGAYRVMRQCVTAALHFSSFERRHAGAGLTLGLDPRGHDKRKPIERSGRKATRLQRNPSRQASRATERSSRRET